MKLKKLAKRAGIAALVLATPLASYLALDSSNREFRNRSYISPVGLAYLQTPNKITNIEILDSKNKLMPLHWNYAYENKNLAYIQIPKNLKQGIYKVTATDVDGNKIKETYIIDPSKNIFQEQKCLTDRTIEGIGKFFGMKIDVGA